MIRTCFSLFPSPVPDTFYVRCWGSTFRPICVSTSTRIVLDRRQTKFVCFSRNLFCDYFHIIIPQASLVQLAICYWPESVFNHLVEIIEIFEHGTQQRPGQLPSTLVIRPHATLEVVLFVSTVFHQVETTYNCREKMGVFICMYVYYFPTIET